MRSSYVRNALKNAARGYEPTADDIAFLAADTNSGRGHGRGSSRRSRRPDMARADEYLAWRTHLADLSDEQLEARFWELVEEIT